MQLAYESQPLTSDTTKEQLMTEMVKDTNQQAAVFLQVIHAGTVEEKGRILQRHPELIHIVNYYNTALKTHSGDNQEFQAKLKNGEYETMLADSVRAGRLSQYSPQTELKARIEIINQDVDSKTNMLNGFDIALVENAKKLHVDLTNYLPVGKSVAEVQQIRKDFYDMYQYAINNNAESAIKTFTIIAKDFPAGLSWRESSQLVKSNSREDILNMQGKPNLGVIGSSTYSEAFLRLHAYRATSLFRYSEADNSTEANTPLLSQLEQNSFQVLALAAREIQQNIPDKDSRSVAFQQLTKIAQNKGFDIFDGTRTQFTDSEAQA